MRRIAEAGHINFPEVPARWQRVFVTANAHQARVAHPDAGGVPGVQRYRHLQDLQLRPRCHRGVRRGDLPAGLQARLQGRHGLSRCQPRDAGALHRRHGEEGDEVRGTSREWKRHPPGPADLHGEIAELRADNERLRRIVHELEAENLQRRQKRSRPELLRGTTRRLETPLGTLYVTITEDERGQPFEVFMTPGQGRRGVDGRRRALGRLISLALRSGIPMKEIYRQLRGISSDRAIGLGANKILSVPDAVGIAIERWMQDKAGMQQELLPGLSRLGRGAGAGGPAGDRPGPEQMMLGGMKETLVGRLPRLRVSARVCRGMHEVPRVRLQRVRMIVVVRR